MSQVADLDAVAGAHRFHPLAVKSVIAETHDTSTFVFDVPPDLAPLFRYHAGQFCTLRARIGAEDVLRCYSMSSTPGIDADLAITVKRVPMGLMSNWLIDNVNAGDTIDVLKPAGTFRFVDAGRPIVAMCGGSGITPVYSIVKHALAHSDLDVRLLVANRDERSVIFAAALARLEAGNPHRLTLVRHLDAVRGYLDEAAVAAFVGERTDSMFYVCGPAQFMELVERPLVLMGIPAERIIVERFVAATPTPDAVEVSELVDGNDPTETLVLSLKGKKHTLAYRPGDTVLHAARRAGLKPPFSCELGNCGSCLALVRTGRATMHANNALSSDEVAGGWVLTCQAVPVGRLVAIDYEAS